MDASFHFLPISAVDVSRESKKVGLSEHAVSWFRNDLSGRSQCVQMAGSSSTFLRVSKGVPQGSVLGPVLF